jgi:hypothetical protein
VSLKANNDPTLTSTTANGEALIDQEPALLIVSSPQLLQGKAAVGPLQEFTPTPAVEPTLATPSQNDASTPQKPSRKSNHSRHKNKRSVMEKKADVVADSAYVPPHVRKRGSILPHLHKRAAATNTATDKDPTSTTNGSSAASVKSAVGQPDKLHASP